MSNPLDEPVSDGEQALAEMLSALSQKDGELALSLAPNALEAALTPGLRARVLSWWAQAARIAGNQRVAEQKLTEAIDAAREAGELEAVADLNELRVRSSDSSQPTGPLLEANLAYERGDLKKAEVLALGAHEIADGNGDVRGQILALLALARLDHRRQSALIRASEVADAHGDPNLITLVAKSRKAAGFPAEKQVF